MARTISRAPLDRQAILSGRHGRPQAETVAFADAQAPLPAQGHHAGPALLPALPRAAPAAPGLPELRHLRRPRGGRAAAGPRRRRVGWSRPRVRSRSAAANLRLCPPDTASPSPACSVPAVLANALHWLRPRARSGSVLARRATTVLSRT